MTGGQYLIQRIADLEFRVATLVDQNAALENENTSLRAIVEKFNPDGNPNFSDIPLRAEKPEPAPENPNVRVGENALRAVYGEPATHAS